MINQSFVWMKLDLYFNQIADNYKTMALLSSSCQHSMAENRSRVLQEGCSSLWLINIYNYFTL